MQILPEVPVSRGDIIENNIQVTDPFSFAHLKPGLSGLQPNRPVPRPSMRLSRA
jgi:hypothetical protein